MPTPLFITLFETYISTRSVPEIQYNFLKKHIDSFYIHHADLTEELIQTGYSIEKIYFREINPTNFWNNAPRSDIYLSCDENRILEDIQLVLVLEFGLHNLSGMENLSSTRYMRIEYSEAQ